MLEILFSDSAAGSLKVGMNHGTEIGGCFGIIATDEKGCPLPPEEIARLQQEVEETLRRNWAEAVPLKGNSRDILPFSLALDVGPIDEDGIGPLREETLARLCDLYPQGQQAAHEMLTTARSHLAQVLDRASREPLRFWVSHNPAELCGLCWLLDALRPVGWEALQMQVVWLSHTAPVSELTGPGGSGSVQPHQWGRLAQLAQPLSAQEAQTLADHWLRLKQENAPLRAVLNGMLVSAPETLYDPYLQQVLDEQEDTFSEATLIGLTLGRFPLGFGDAWLDLRVEQWIADGKLEAITLPAPDAPRYHRQLRKVLP